MSGPPGRAALAGDGRPAEAPTVGRAGGHRSVVPAGSRPDASGHRPTGHDGQPERLFATTVPLPATIGDRMGTTMPALAAHAELPLAGTGPWDAAGGPIRRSAVDIDAGFALVGPRGGLCALGAAATVALPEGLQAAAPTIRRHLAAIATVDPIGRPGSGPLAVGALPFDPTAPTSLVVPRLVLVRRAGGLAWATLVSHEPREGRDVLDAVDRVLTEAAVTRLASPGPAAAAASVVGWHLRPEEAAFEDMVRRALDAIASRQVGKVVLARSVEVTLDRPADIAAVVEQLRRHEPASTVFLHRRAGRTFVGATPELLVRRRHDQVLSHPLAGTARRSAGDDAALTLLGAPKERAEHAAAADAVADALRPWCRSLRVPPAPTPVVLATMVHLGTRITGTLRPAAESGALPDAWTLAGALHPTPAVAGVPTDAALEVIGALEPTPRGPYAGPVGWMDRRGDGDVLVAIRSAMVEDRRAVAHAGVGIVAGSDPARELAETTTKLAVALGALGLDVGALATASPP